jgi:hypothetical protein
MPHVRLPVYHPDRSAKHRRRSRMLAHMHTRTHASCRPTHACANTRRRAHQSRRYTARNNKHAPTALHAALSPHALWRPRLRAAVVGRPPRARACGCAETAPARRGSAALPPAVSVGRCMLQAAGCMLHVAFCCGRAAARGVRCPLHVACCMLHFVVAALQPAGSVVRCMLHVAFCCGRAAAAAFWIVAIQCLITMYSGTASQTKGALSTDTGCSESSHG